MPAIEMQGVYRGIPIEYQEHIDEFSAHFSGEGSGTVHAKTLKAMKRKIDNALRKDLKSVPVFTLNHWSYEVEQGVVTSEACSSGGEMQAWVTRESKLRNKIGGKSRRLVSIDDGMYLDTKDNREKAAKIRGIKLKIEEVEKDGRSKISAILRTMKPYKPQLTPDDFQKE